MSILPGCHYVVLAKYYIIQQPKHKCLPLGFHSNIFLKLMLCDLLKNFKFVHAVSCCHIPVNNSQALQIFHAISCLERHLHQLQNSKSLKEKKVITNCKSTYKGCTLHYHYKCQFSVAALTPSFHAREWLFNIGGRGGLNKCGCLFWTEKWVLNFV